MEKQTLGIGMLMVAFVAIVVGIALLNSAASTVQSSTNTVALTDYSVTSGTNGNYVALTGYQSVISSYTIKNGTTDATTGLSLNNTVVNGAPTLVMYTNDAAYNNKVVNVTAASVAPTGYIPDGASRSIAGLIIIFGALAIAVVALFPVIKDKLLDMF